ncbi:hypothetical protein C3L33_12230, partial [Rhododendron williamsianum]
MAENGEGEKHELENNNFKKKKKKRREVGGIKTMPFILGEGLVSITISATLPQLRPPPCPTQENCKEASSNQLWILYLSLLLSSLGSGGIRPCVVTFAADQFDMSKSKVESRKWNFFNWYYFCMVMASLTALTVVVYIQDNVGWGLGLGIPTIAMAISVVAFVSGSPLYRRVKPMGSPLVRLAQVIVAAVKKRKEVAPEDPAMLYENRELDAGISSNGRLLHSGQYKYKPLEEVSESNGEGDVELARESTKENVLKDANGNGEVVVVTKGETN